MATFNDMVEEVSLHLAGYTMRQDRTTHLTSSLTNTGLSVVVASVDNISKGLIEIDDELMWVDSFDRSSSTLTISPYGRGYFGTTATSHAANARVTIAPTFPRHSIKKAINDTILSAYPKLFGISSTTFQYNPAVNTYALPNDAGTILSVSYEELGSSKEWLPVRNWRVDTSASPTFNSNTSISIYSGVTAGSDIRVVFSTRPEILENSSDDFAYTTGFEDSVKDVIILGAAYRLLSFVDPGRLTYSSPEADIQTGKIMIGSGTNAAKYVYALFQQRFNEEAEKLKNYYPVRVHYTR